MPNNIKNFYVVALVAGSVVLFGGADGCIDSRADGADVSESSSGEQDSDPTGSTGSNNKDDGSKANQELAAFSCRASLDKEPTKYQSYYVDGFNHYGAFLLHYQDLIQSKGLTEANKELNALMGMKYDDLALAKVIGKADQELKDPMLRQHWKDWCEHPDNFFSWFMIPAYIYPVKPKDVGDLIAPVKAGHCNIHYQAEGMWFFKWATGLKGEACYSGKKPDHQTWCPTRKN